MWTEAQLYVERRYAKGIKLSKPCTLWHLGEIMDHEKITDGIYVIAVPPCRFTFNGQVHYFPHYLPAMTSDVIANLSALEFDVAFTLYEMVHSVKGYTQDEGMILNLDPLINYFIQVKAPTKNNIPLFKKKVIKSNCTRMRSI